jgi:predicted nucleic acid-binding protein
MNRFVLDASMALSWLLADEANPSSLAVQKALVNADEVFVPAHWHLEVANSIWMAERRKRLNAAGVAEAASLCSQLPVSIDPESARRATVETLEISRQHGISVYDAAYLELAMRRGATLASLDEPLRKVAKKSGVPILPV